MTLKTGDASTAHSTICYRMQNSTTIIEFNRGELDYGYELRRAVREDQRKCSLIEKELLPGDLPSGLRLGMSIREFKKALGPSAKSTGAVAEKKFVWEKAMTAREAELQGYFLKDKTYYWKVLVFVRGIFNQGRLVNLQVSKSEQE